MVPGFIIVNVVKFRLVLFPEWLLRDVYFRTCFGKCFHKLGVTILRIQSVQGIKGLSRWNPARLYLVRSKWQSTEEVCVAFDC